MRPRALGVLAGSLLLVMYFARVGGFPLQDPDEGRYAEIAREMATSGDWVTPTLHGVKYFDKPPLLYWLVAAAFRAFGLSEGVARLVPAAAGVATVFMTFLLGRSMLGPTTGMVAAVILATSPLFFFFSQALTTDMLLTACMTATMGALWASFDGTYKPRWTVLVAVMAALGVLAKGLVAVVLPGIIAVLFLVSRGRASLLRRLLAVAPVVAFIALAAPWFVALSWTSPEFVDYFFIKQHLERFATASVGHPEGPLFYVPILLVGALPWTLVLAGVLWADGRTSYGRLPFEERRFLLLWALAVLVFFTFARSKLPAYILPALPPLALLAAGCLGCETWCRSGSRIAHKTVVGLVSVGAALALAALVACPYARDLSGALGRDRSDVEIVLRTVILAGGVLASTGAAVLAGWSRFSGSPARSVSVVAACAAVFLFVLLGGREVVKTSRDIGHAIRASHRPGDVVISYRRLLHGLPFYTGVRGVQAIDFGELDFGARTAQDAEEFFWSDTARISAAWQSGRRVFVVTSGKFEQELRGLLKPPPRTLLRDADRLVLVNFPPVQDRDVAAQCALGGRDGCLGSTPTPSWRADARPRVGSAGPHQPRQRDRL